MIIVLKGEAHRNNLTTEKLVSGQYWVLAKRIELKFLVMIIVWKEAHLISQGLGWV